VVQRDDLKTGLSQVILAMISSNLARAGHPSRIAVSKASSMGRQMGLRTDSVIMTDNLATVLEVEVDQVIGHTPNAADLDVALRHTLGLH
jgi:mRNA interferase MazF